MFSFVSDALFSLPKLFAPMLSFSLCYFNALLFRLHIFSNQWDWSPFSLLLLQLNQFTNPIWQIPVSSQNALKCLPSPKVPLDLALFIPVLSFCLSLSSCLITSFISFFYSFSAAEIFCALIPLHTYCALKPVVDLSLSLPLLPSNVPQLRNSYMSSCIHIFWNWGPVYSASWV